MEGGGHWREGGHWRGRHPSRPPPSPHASGGWWWWWWGRGSHSHPGGLFAVSLQSAPAAPRRAGLLGDTHPPTHPPTPPPPAPGDIPVPMYWGVPQRLLRVTPSRRRWASPKSMILMRGLGTSFSSSMMFSGCGDRDGGVTGEAGWRGGDGLCRWAQPPREGQQHPGKPGRMRSGLWRCPIRGDVAPGAPLQERG